MRKEREYFTDAEDTKIVALRTARPPVSYSEIGRQMGRPYQSIRARWIVLSEERDCRKLDALINGGERRLGPAFVETAMLSSMPLKPAIQARALGGRVWR